MMTRKMAALVFVLALSGVPGIGAGEVLSAEPGEIQAESAGPDSPADTLSAMDAVRKNFGVSFVYDSSLERKLENLAVPENFIEKVPLYGSVKKCLGALLAGSGIDWSVSGKYVVLRSSVEDQPGKRDRFTVSGYIRDASSGETLIGAGVLDGRSADVPAGAVTNEYGYYTLTVQAGETSLSYSYVGYKPESRELLLRRDTVINVSLSPSAELNAAKIVTSGEVGIESAYMGALEIPQEMIRNTPVVLGEPDVIKTIQMMPGVQSGMEGFSGLYVRGGGGDENLMMLDGAPLYNVGHLFGLLSVFTPEAVKKVTFYKGSFPARYGGRVSSIVDVRTNDGNAKEFHGSVSAGLLSEKLHFEGPVKDSNTTYSISVRGMHTLLFDRIIKCAGSPANYAFYDINAKVTHRFSDSDRLHFGFYNGRDYFRADDSKTEETPAEDIDPGGGIYTGTGNTSVATCSRDDSKVRINWGNTLAVLRWNHVFNSRLFANTSVSWNRYGMKLYAYSRDYLKVAEDVSDNRYEYAYTSSIRDWGARMDFDYAPSPSHLVKFGGEFIRHAYHPEMEQINNREENNVVSSDTTYSNAVSSNIRGNELSVWIEDDMAFGQHVTFNPGIHLSLFNVNGKTYFSPEPRVSLKVSFAVDWAVKSAYSRMSQYVHQLTSGNLSLPTDLWVPITRNIKPVKSDIVSLGTYFSGLKGWEFSVEGYWKKLANVLEYKDGKMALSSASDWESNVAMGDGRSYGAELYVRKTAGRTTGTLSYTLSKSERIFRDGSINNGKWFPFVYDRRHNVCLAVNQKLGKRIDLSAVWTCMSGNWMTVPTRKSFVISPDGKDYIEIDYVESRNNYKLPPSHRLDFSINIRKQKKRGERIWNFGMYNAYGALNPNWVVYDSVQKTDPETGRTERMPALSKRTYLIFLPSFSYTFKF